MLYLNNAITNYVISLTSHTLYYTNKINLRWNYENRFTSENSRIFHANCNYNRYLFCIIKYSYMKILLLYFSESL